MIAEQVYGMDTTIVSYINKLLYADTKKRHPSGCRFFISRILLVGWSCVRICCVSLLLDYNTSNDNDSKY